MRSLLAFATLVLVFSTALRSSSAQEIGDEKGTFGIGIIVGEPTGIAAKLYLSQNTAIDGAVGSAIIGGGIHAHVDFLLHPWILEDRESFTMPAYVGLGGRFLSHNRGAGGDDDVHLGPRVVIGMLFDFKSIPLDVFVEVAGVGELRFGSDDDNHSGFGLSINAGAGARYYF